MPDLESAPASALGPDAKLPIEPPPHALIREPVRSWLSLDLRDVWRHRELLALLVWRNLIVRYKQSVVGIGWAVIRPVTSMVVFSVIFGKLAKLPSDGVPYPIFTYIALLPWNYFAGCLNGTSNSLVDAKAIATKVYFPRLILPLSYLFTGLVDFCIAFLVLVVMMCWYHDFVSVSWHVLLLPLFMLLAMLTALACGLWLGSLMVKYRDVKQLLSYMIQVWMYLTPVAYSTSLVPDRWRFVYSLNPMACVIDGFRWALLGRAAPHWGGMAVSLCVVVLLGFSGLYYFRRTESTFADIV